MGDKLVHSRLVDLVVITQQEREREGYSGQKLTSSANGLSFSENGKLERFLFVHAEDEEVLFTEYKNHLNEERK